jgi:putative ABC transport system substrate-binding protein
MKRREVIALLGGAVMPALWPLAARAQPAIKRIGVLIPAVANDSESQERIGALQKGLQDLGWTEGKDYRFEFRWPGPGAERIRAHAIELVGLAPDLIVTGSVVAAQVMLQESRSIPIVFANISDPVGVGLIPSLAYPGRNITGFTAFEYTTAGKWLETLMEIAPHIMRVAVVFGATEIGPHGENFFRAIQAAAPSFNVNVTAIRVRNSADIEPAVDQFAATPNGGLIGAAEPGAIRNRDLIIGLAARHHLPAVYPFRFFVEEGGLASYGIDLNDQYRRAASYVDRILKGANPADLPVQAPDKFELIINLKTAKALGIDIPESFLLRADEVIE